MLIDSRQSTKQFWMRQGQRVAVTLGEWQSWRFGPVLGERVNPPNFRAPEGVVTNHQPVLEEPLGWSCLENDEFAASDKGFSPN